MADIRIDTSGLTSRKFAIAEIGGELVDGEHGPTLSLEPGTYSFRQSPHGPAVQFIVTPAGVLDYPSESDQFLHGRGGQTLRVVGYSARFDLTGLSHDLSLVLLGDPVSLGRAEPRELRLVPGTYVFVLARGLADMEFIVGQDGQLFVTDPALAGCVTITDRVVRVLGYSARFDLTGLSHDLNPILLGDSSAVLSRTEPRELRLVPGTYAFLLARGLADVELVVARNGQLAVGDPATAGCVTITDRVVRVLGYSARFDLTGLSHDLNPILLGDSSAVLSRAEPRELRLVPGTYAFLLARGLADVELVVARNGQLAVGDPATAGCVTITDRVVRVLGYSARFDLTGLSHDLNPILLGDSSAVLSRAEPRELRLVPGTYAFLLARGLADVELVVARNGQLAVGDPATAGCVTITDRVVRVLGYSARFDLTGLSHDLNPILLGDSSAVLSRAEPRELRLVPGTYAFLLARGLADVELVVARNGQLAVGDPATAGCVTITDRVVRVLGYSARFDLTGLSHDLNPILLGDSSAVLSRAEPRELRLVPGTYAFLLARGLADLEVTVRRTGQLDMSDPTLAACVTVVDRTVRIVGYPVTFTLRGLFHDLRPELLGDPNAVLTRDTPTQVRLVPATYLLWPNGPSGSQFAVTIARNGRILH